MYTHICPQCRVVLKKRVCDSVTSNIPSAYQQMPVVARARLNLLESLRCSIFATSYNPTSMRTGAKYLKARLRGPSMLNYYPKILKISDFNKLFPELKLEDEDEVQRQKDLAALRARGKGAPKKAKTKS